MVNAARPWARTTTSRMSPSYGDEGVGKIGQDNKLVVFMIPGMPF